MRVEKEALQEAVGSGLRCFALCFAFLCFACLVGTSCFTTMKPFLPLRSLLLLFFSSLLFRAVVASAVTAYADSGCVRSWRALDAVNGYPDGLCKPLNVTVGQSFQVQELDAGCAGMYIFSWTLYGFRRWEG